MHRVAMILAALLLLPASRSALAQGMNNDYPFDSTDVKNAFSMLGLEAFKFPVRVAADSSMMLSYTVEVYEDGNLERTISQQDTRKKMPKEFVRMLAEESMLATTEKFVRVYWLTRAPGDVALRLVYEHATTAYTFELDTAKFGLSQCRAMNWPASQITEKKPVSVYYSTSRGKELISCPGNAPVEQIVKRYSHVIVVYVEPVAIPE